jgi:hypothetical protein
VLSWDVGDSQVAWQAEELPCLARLPGVRCRTASGTHRARGKTASTSTATPGKAAGGRAGAAAGGVAAAVTRARRGRARTERARRGVAGGNGEEARCAAGLSRQVAGLWAGALSSPGKAGQASALALARGWHPRGLLRWLHVMADG